MKLKEKLAEEYATEDHDIYWHAEQLAYISKVTHHAFLAGFEKAREMAAPFVTKALDGYASTEYHEILELGEEEVK